MGEIKMALRLKLLIKAKALLWRFFVTPLTISLKMGDSL